MSSDPLRALFYPFEKGLLPLPKGETLFIGGQICKDLGQVDKERLTTQQYFKPYAAALEQAGYRTIAEIPQDQEASYDAVLIAGTRQHQENIYAMAAGLNILKKGGLFLCAAANDKGGKRLKKDAQTIGLSVFEESKYKSRIIWNENTAIDRNDLSGIMAEGEYQDILEGDHISRPGIFGWNRIDTGSDLLIKTIDHDDIKGVGADFGCGYGYLAKNILKNDSVTTIHCIDADSRAVEACRRTFKNDPRATFLWADLTGSDSLPGQMDFIVMNPPFHQGVHNAPQAGQKFIEKAAKSLKKGGILWMVANNHLPYEAILKSAFTQSDMIKNAQGFKIFRAVA